MKLDLREIIDVPGGRVSFSQELSTERLSSPSIVRYDAGPSAEGVVENFLSAAVMGRLETVTFATAAAASLSGTSASASPCR